MKSPFQRIAALALCFTLTLGAFAYRPSEAKALAGVDDAVVIGALLSAFAGGCGLIFSNNGMTSGELAQGLTDKWNEFKAAVLETDTTFAGWLGYEDMDALLQAIVLSGGKALTVPRLVARKFADFTNWLKDNLGISAGGDSVLLTDAIDFSSLTWEVDSSFGRDFGYYFSYSLSSSLLRLSASKPVASDSELWGFIKSKPASVSEAGDYTFNFSGVETHSYKASATSSPVVRFGQVLLYVQEPSGKNLDVHYFVQSGTHSSFSGSHTVFIPADCSFYLKFCAYGNVAVSSQTFQWSGSAARSSSNSFSVSNPAGVQTPDLAGDEAANPTLSGVGDGTATSIEGLLQQILAQLQANTLAPTLDLAGTESGGNTGADEDAKPYLPYIPQIFGKIKELPGTLANIWESIKGIPAAIAEKIGAFFTTLWGWLQSIIDAITALPAAIAEKIGALFKPDEALLTEITDNFKGKFGFFSTLKQFGSDLFGMTPETEPPVIWVHLENAESKFGYNYGDKQKIFDMTWYQKYKASVDGLLSGFLWLGYLWLLFKRAPSILNGMQMDEDLRPPLLVGDVSSAPRLGAGDPSIHYGEGFTFRSKGGRRK